MIDVICNFGLLHTLSDKSKLFDYRVLMCKLDLLLYISMHVSSDRNMPGTVIRRTRKHNVSSIHDTFLTKPTTVTIALRSVIERMEAITIRQAEVDAIYNDSINDEMDETLDHRDVFQSAKSGYKHRCRPYWSDTLSALWKDARVAEKTYMYLRAKSHDQQSNLRTIFKDKRKLFDRNMRKNRSRYIIGVYVTLLPLV